MKILDEDRTGEQLGAYRLIRLLGRGLQSEVYLGEGIGPVGGRGRLETASHPAWGAINLAPTPQGRRDPGEHSRFDAPVAIKILSESVTKQDIKKFLLHASTLAQLKHPSIVQVVDFGLEGNVPFIVMEYAAPGNIRQRHPKGSIVPLETVIGYVQQIASALDYVHARKLIHRDIKPSNMLLRSDNSVMLSDFGIAITAHSLDSMEEEDFEGTILYAAPEQLQGRPRRSSDLYALGVVVYEWLTGEWPFSGTFAEIARQHLFAPPPGLRQRNEAIPPDVEKAVLKALAKDPTKRFASVRHFAAALERAVRAQQHAPARTSSKAPATKKRQFVPPLPFEPLPVSDGTEASERAEEILTRLANGTY